MCNKCLIEEECVCLKDAMANVKSSEGLNFIADFLARQRESRKQVYR